MQPQPHATAHSLYTFYETLPNEVQQAFLQELLQKQEDKLEELSLYLACRKAKEENEFLSDEEALTFIAALPQ